MKTRYKIMGTIIIAIVIISTSLTVASPSINNFDDFLYQLREPFDGPEPEPVGFSIPSGHQIISYNGTNCSPSEILNATCFIDAFTKCTNAKISKTIFTIEGDPITTFALMNSTSEMCKN